MNERRVMVTLPMGGGRWYGTAFGVNYNAGKNIVIRVTEPGASAYQRGSVVDVHESYVTYLDGTGEPGA